MLVKVRQHKINPLNPVRAIHPLSPPLCVSLPHRLQKLFLHVLQRRDHETPQAEDTVVYLRSCGTLAVLVGEREGSVRVFLEWWSGLGRRGMTPVWNEEAGKCVNLVRRMDEMRVQYFPEGKLRERIPEGSR